MGVNHSTQGHRDRQRHQQPGAASPATSAGRARRRSRSPASATRWARARPASPRACPAIASSRARRIAPSWPRSGTCRSSAFPTARGLAYPDIIEAALDRRIRALWIIAHQSDRLVPESRRAEAGARGTSSSWSCRTASIRRRRPSSRDLVLPAAIWGEKEGTYTNSERRVSKVNAAVRPAGRGAVRLRHLLDARRRARRARRAVPRLDDARATPSTSGGASRPAGSATTRA